MRINTPTNRSFKGKSFNINNGLIPYKFDLITLDLLCNYIITDNRNVRRANYVSLKNVIDTYDPDCYVNDSEKYKRVIFIQRGLQARLQENLQNRSLILKYINGGFMDGNLIDVDSFQPLSNSDLDSISKMISESIEFGFVYQEGKRQLDLWTRFNNADFTSVGKIVEEIEQKTADLNTKFRKAKSVKSTERAFSLNKETMATMVTDAWNEVTSTYRKLVTGMQGFNQLIGGGFENTRVYLFLGLTGAGKSMTLLNIVKQIKQYNPTYKTKDPTKIPCCVILTMENTVTETIQRLFQISTGEDFAKQSTPDEALHKLITTGQLFLSTESPIDIIIKYEPNKSKDTGYLYTMADDLEDEGYELIALVLDHAKRIRSVERNADVRLELGDIINELKTFAMLKDIPVITNSHLNRDAARTIDESAGKSKSDLTRMLGKSNIGESMLMLDNVDFACIVNPEYDSEGRKWMVFREIKTRVKIMREYICQPFDTENEIKLIEDFYAPVPVFRETMYTSPVMNNGSNMNNSISNNNTKQRSTPYMEPKNQRFANGLPIDNEDTNIFESADRFVTPQIIEEPVNIFEIPANKPFIMDKTIKVDYDTLPNVKVWPPTAEDLNKQQVLQ